MQKLAGDAKIQALESSGGRENALEAKKSSAVRTVGADPTASSSAWGCERNPKRRWEKSKEAHGPVSERRKTQQKTKGDRYLEKKSEEKKRGKKTSSRGRQQEVEPELDQSSICRVGWVNLQNRNESL